ncbi:MAG: heavy-metal-associated domain-containing protein [Abditibacteriales bacterium]|nr:heavy-metal-associated domain-containing protein [Abditibacteriales bacterium]MDW8366135.1 heavy metal-associated domain-containing protein [Abditibacteriales bacterium]
MGCPSSVKAALAKVKGVKSTEVDFGKKQASVTLEKSSKASLSEMMTSLKKAGYKPSAM